MQTLNNHSFPLHRPPLDIPGKGLWSALECLDLHLEQAVKMIQEEFSIEACADPFRGLHINMDEVSTLLTQAPGRPRFLSDTTGPDRDSPASFTQLDWLARAFGLSQFDKDVVLITLAPEIDLRYERLYAYLQDNISHRHPSIDLVLNLLCVSEQDKLARRVHFAPDAPLIKNGLIHLFTESDPSQSSLLAHYLKLDDQIIQLLLGLNNVDPRLLSFCQMIRPDANPHPSFSDSSIKQTLAAAICQAEKAGQPIRAYFYGPRGTGKQATAEALAGGLDLPLLTADFTQVVSLNKDWSQLLQVLFREAWFQGAILYLSNFDKLADPCSQQLLESLAGYNGIVIMAGTQPWVPPGSLALGVVPISFAIPAAQQRSEIWQACLAEQGLELAENDILVLADRFQLTPGQIADAVVTAGKQALWKSAGLITTSAIENLFAAARAQSGHDLAALAHKVEPRYAWDDIVLPDDTMAQLREMCQRVAYRQHIFNDWGFDRKLSLGKGVNALFIGPSGTGKTMAAEIIANELGLDLYKIDLSGIVSKYIGETEKNLDRIFTAAEHANAILFFDEADALFGKRSEVHDSHDRYANLEISYLLQKMDQYEGIAILATNLRQNLDEAFVRRLAFTVHFPFPDEASRQRIWAGIWPKATPLGPDVDAEFLSRQFKLSGGNIKNIALAASFLAAADGGTVIMDHLFHATRREYQKLGKNLSGIELRGEMHQLS